jgi:hypothetical protein
MRESRKSVNVANATVDINAYMYVGMAPEPPGVGHGGGENAISNREEGRIIESRANTDWVWICMIIVDEEDGERKAHAKCGWPGAPTTMEKAIWQADIDDRE